MAPLETFERAPTEPVVSTATSSALIALAIVAAGMPAVAAADDEDVSLGERATPAEAASRAPRVTTERSFVLPGGAAPLDPAADPIPT